MAARRGKAKRSVLARQKPKRARKTSLVAALWSRLPAKIAVAALSLAALGFGAYRLVPRLAQIISRDQGAGWKVALKLDSGQTLSDAQWAHIYETARKNLGDGDAADLRRAATAIQHVDAFARVSVVRTGPREVIVALATRTPLFCVKADVVRYVGRDAAVFGAPERLTEQCPGPIVTGIFESRGSRRLNLGEDLTLEVSADETAALKEIIDLRDETQRRKLPIRAIEYQSFRGVLVSLESQDGLEPVLGHGPFGAKLDKFETLALRLKEKGETAARIELDYQGKAFIKYKKM